MEYLLVYIDYASHDNASSSLSTLFQFEFFFLSMNSHSFKHYSRWGCIQPFLHDVNISPSQMDKPPLTCFKVILIFFATTLWLVYIQNIRKTKFNSVLLKITSLWLCSSRTHPPPQLFLHNLLWDWQYLITFCFLQTWLVQSQYFLYVTHENIKLIQCQIQSFLLPGNPFIS